jgi:hypothetical protein
MRRGLVLWVGVVIGATACADRPAANRSAPHGSSSSPVPAVARVVCETWRTRVLTPTVLAQRNGVLFSIENVTEQTFVFSPAHDERPGTQSEFASSGDNSVPPGVKQMRWRVPPGLIQLVCTPKGKPLPRDQIRSKEAVIRIVDPDRVYVPVPSTLDCEGGADRSHGLSLPVRSDDPQEPVRVTRERLQGLRPGDVVARTGYPEDDSPQVKIVREGRVVGLVSMEPFLAQGLLWTCVSSRIRRADPPANPNRAHTPSPITTERFPPQSKLMEGESYWVLYLAIAEKGSPEIDEAVGRAHLYGYSPHVRRLDCDEGAAEAFRLPRDFLAVAVYFERERDPWFVGDAINAPHWELTRIRAHCVD